MALHLMRTGGRHRGKTPAQLRHELDGAGLYIAQLQEDQRINCADVEDSRRQAREAQEQLRGARETLSDLARQLGEATDEILRLRRQLAPYLAAEANAAAVDVPPMVRDTRDGADQATAPTGTDVSELRDSYYADPARWQASDDTVPLRIRFDEGTVRRLHKRPDWATDDNEKGDEAA